MSLLTTLNYPGTLVETTTDLKLVAKLDTFISSNLNTSGQDSSSASRDLRIQAGISDIVYIGPLGQASDSSSSAGLALPSIFVTPGTHVILLITHGSGGSVNGVTDPGGNTWTIDQPSTFSGSLGVAVASARINNAIYAGDNILITWNAAVSQKAVVGEVFRGILATNYVDKKATNADLGYQISTGLTAQTVSSKELVIGNLNTLGAYDITFVPDSATNLQERSSQPGNANNHIVTGAFKITTTQGTYTVTGTLT